MRNEVSAEGLVLRLRVGGPRVAGGGVAVDVAYVLSTDCSYQTAKIPRAGWLTGLCLLMSVLVPSVLWKVPIYGLWRNSVLHSTCR